MSEILLYKANECTAKLNTASEVVTQVTFIVTDNDRITIMPMIMIMPMITTIHMIMIIASMRKSLSVDQSFKTR